MKNLLAAVALLACAAVGVGGAVALAGSTTEKITICHVAGLASDPANLITLTLPPQAVFGPGGHFNEDGTPQAGHEQDYMGPCNPEEPPPTTTEPPPTTTEPPPTTTEPPPTVTSPPGQPKCVPTGAGQDGNVPPGGNTNDNCLPLTVPPPPTTTTTATAPPPPTVASTASPPPPPATTPPPPVVKVSSKPAVSAPKGSTKVVRVEKKSGGVVRITTADGKTHTGIMGSG